MRQDYVDKDEKMWNLNQDHPSRVGIHPADLGANIVALVFLVASIVLLLMD